MTSNEYEPTTAHTEGASEAPSTAHHGPAGHHGHRSGADFGPGFGRDFRRDLRREFGEQFGRDFAQQLGREFGRSRGFGPGGFGFGGFAAAAAAAAGDDSGDRPSGPGFGPGRRGRRGGFGPEGGGPHGMRGGHGRGRGRGRGPGGPGGWQQADLPSADDAGAWLAARLPDDWYVGEPSVSVDRDEIVVIGELAAPEATEGQTADAAAAAAQGRIDRFREQTRDERVTIADEAEARYGRKLAWGASIGDTEVVFTNLAVPAMTRLRHDERRVLDTLVDSGVARSRSDALVWCVRLVGEHADEWLGGLREAMSEVDKLRAEGPTL